MKLGFIGTGKIAASVITGICKSEIIFKKILVSPRNRLTARKLSKKFNKVFIAKNNQEIIDTCNWIFLCVTPIVGDKIIKQLKLYKFQVDQLIKYHETQEAKSENKTSLSSFLDNLNSDND